MNEKNLILLGIIVVSVLLLGNITVTALARVEQVQVVGSPYIRVKGQPKVQVVSQPKSPSLLQTRRRAQKWAFAVQWIEDGAFKNWAAVGELGWEVVACRRAHNGATPRKWGSECVFKRPALGLVTKEVKVKKVSVGK